VKINSGKTMIFLTTKTWYQSSLLT